MCIAVVLPRRLATRAMWVQLPTRLPGFFLGWRMAQSSQVCSRGTAGRQGNTRVVPVATTHRKSCVLLLLLQVLLMVW